jgi:hypothetical protein
VLSRVPSRGVDIEAIEAPSAPGVWVPAWLFLPRSRDVSKPALLLLDAGGRNRDWREGALYQNLAAQGYPVCAADIRMIGDMLPEFGRGAEPWARAHESEEDFAWSSLILGKPLAGQRVTDILALATALRAHPALSGRALRVAASGRLTVPALFAAALDPAIASLYLAGGLVSFRSVVDTEIYNASFANFVPRLLLETDLPQVAASLAPRRLTLAGAVNGAGDGVGSAEVRALYAGGHITIEPSAEWSEAALAG